MKKSVALLVGLAAVSTSATAQIRPEECRPVFPLNDPVQSALPQDVVAERVVPAASRRSFFGLPFLPFLLAGGGLAALIGGGGGSSTDVDPVSPA